MSVKLICISNPNCRKCCGTPPAATYGCLGKHTEETTSLACGDTGREKQAWAQWASCGSCSRGSLRSSPSQPMRAVPHACVCCAWTLGSPAAKQHCPEAL